MNNLFYAKSSPPELLEEHILSVLSAMYCLKRNYPNILSNQLWQALEDIIKAHDLGKLDNYFQYKINLIKDKKSYDKSENEIFHNFLSLAITDIDEWNNKYGTELSYAMQMAVLYHHDRPVSELLKDRQKFIEYVNNSLIPNANNFSFIGYSIPDKINKKYIGMINNQKITDFTNDYILLKGLLNRCDYSGSAHIPIEEDTYVNGYSIADLTNNYIRQKGFAKRKLQVYLEQHKDDNVVVVASTGSGKTEGALLWSDNAKTMYTLPLKVSINAINDRIVNNIGYTKSLLLHSDAVSYYNNINHKQFKTQQEQNNYNQLSPSQKRNLARTYNAPYTVCTIDQILKCAFKFNGAEMALATLSYSKLIIDEIQAYSPQLIGTILCALKMITDLGGKFAIITATFPPVLKTLMQRYKIPFNESEEQFYGFNFNRHCIEVGGNEFDINRILKDSKTKKVLIVCNTVAHAQNLYNTLNTQSDNCHLLHSLFLKKDRKILEDKIIAFAPNSTNRNNNSGIWISTQIVEASLDIDFDILYTEMCSIDSLIQRMGRVYRNREYTDTKNANIVIIDNHNGVMPNFIHPEIYVKSMIAINTILNKNKTKLLGEVQGNDDKTKMINSVYPANSVNSAYANAINQQYNNLMSLKWHSTEKKQVDILFRNIDSITVCPYTIYNRLKEIGKVDEWNNVLNNTNAPYSQKQRIKDKINSYTVSISYYRNLDIDYDTELFYNKSHIYKYNGEYDFNEKTTAGLGIIKSFAPNTNNTDIIM